MGKAKKSFKKFSRKGKVEHAVKNRRAKRSNTQKFKAKNQKRLNRKQEVKKAAAAAASASSGPVEEFADDTEKVEPLGSMDSFLASFGVDESDSGLEDAPEGEDGAEAGEEEAGEEDAAEAEMNEVEQHKQDLELLKESDPDFYAYLQKSGQSLLEFEDPAPALGPGEKAADDSKLVEDLSTETAPHHKGRTLTLSMFQRFKTGALSGSMTGIKKMLKAFRAACAVNSGKSGKKDDEAEAEEGRKLTAPGYRITNSSVFSNLLIFCLGELPGVFAKLLDYNPSPDDGERVRLPRSSKKWSRVLPYAKSFGRSVISLVEGITDKAMLTFILQQADKFVPYLASMPRTAKMFLKRVVNVWSTTDDESVCTSAFLRIRHLSMAHPAKYLDLTLKATYLAFVRRASATNEFTLPKIYLLQKCVVELFCLDTASSYQHAFVYIRQLAIHLRGALRARTRTSSKKICNWQFLNCLRLWAAVLCHNAGDALQDQSLQDLVYPLVQITLGAATLMPSAAFFPFRLHCASLLIALSRQTKVYIPVAPLLLEVLQANMFLRTKGKKEVSSTAKPPNLMLHIHLSASSQKTRVVRDKVINRTFTLLGEFFDVHRDSIAFPELTCIPITMLRQFSKNSGAAEWRHAAQHLIKCLRKRSETIERKRRDCDFGPADTVAMARFMQQHKSPPLFPKEVTTKSISAKQQRGKRTRPAAKTTSNEQPKKFKQPAQTNSKDASEDIVQDFQWED